jgi:very-short-patch-repair endonuclease
MTTDRVRHLRANMTDAEQQLWRILRMRQLGGRRFRRQFQIGPFIADFACPELRLVIEVDGGQHADSASDAMRDLWLQSEGWKVVRFWNNEVLRNLEGVHARLEGVIAELSPPA